jgi:hypothetical protein
MIQILKEITEWGDQKVSNGYYYVNSSGYLIGYMPPLGPYKEFKKPIKQFSKSRRKFELIGEWPEELPEGAITVQGSNGNTYTIHNEKCSCPGFKFRGTCKHLVQVA